MSLPRGLFVSALPLNFSANPDLLGINTLIISLHTAVTFVDIFLSHFYIQLLSTNFKIFGIATRTSFVLKLSLLLVFH